MCGYNIKKTKSICVSLLVVMSHFIFSNVSSLDSAVDSKELSPSDKSTIQTDETATQNEISDREARLELARVLSYLKKYEEALQEYQKLLPTHPNPSQLRIEIAKILYYQGKADDALTELAKVNPEDLNDEAIVLLADLHLKKKNYSKAEKIYAEYLRKFPEDDKVRLKIAELLSWQKRYNESLSQYEIVLQRHPEDVQVRRRYAQVLTWAGKDDQAIREWKESLKNVQ